MKAHKFEYPPARRADVVDDFHGTLVADPYRWLEDADSAETRAFIAAQSELTEAYLSEIPIREQIRQRLTELTDYERNGIPTAKAGQYFFWRNDGLQNQPVCYRQQTLTSEPHLVLDPNTLSDDGTSAVTLTYLNKDASKLAYVVTHGGSDWQEIRIRDVASGQDHDEIIPFVRFSGIIWHPDGSGFYYNGHPDPAGRPEAEANMHSTIYWHTLDSDPSEDRVVYARPDAKELGLFPLLTDDEQFIVVRLWHGAINRNRLHYRRFAAEGGEFIRLIDEPDARYDFVGNDGDTFYLLTDLDAPNLRVVAVDINHPERENWCTIVPEAEGALQTVRIVNGCFVLVYLHDAYNQIKLATLTGEFVGEIPLPAMGTVVMLTGGSADSELFFDFYSFLYPLTAFHYDFKSATLTPFRPPSLAFDTCQFETTQLFATSKDGTQVPLFVTHRKGIMLDGSHPTILYAYGGYSINLTPRFAVSRLQWLEMGGIYAQAVLRGGAEYGEAWHRAGMLENKQNVFDDFIACAEYLIDAGYTTQKKLAVQGGSNGGLLVGACMIQRPDLYGAVLCHVPVLDMLRYHKFTAGRYWIPEYGNAEDAEQFDFMYAYSPLHNVKEGETYPPTLILTADKDDRVVPMHAHKFAAQVQLDDSGENPILLRFEFQAGHGFGKSTSKLIDEATDIHAFLWRVLNM